MSETTVTAASSPNPVVKGLGLLFKGLAHAREAYHNWSDLEVCNPLPHRIYAFFALPRWFGSWPSFKEEARAAMARTEHIIGKATYAIFYLELFEYDKDDPLERLDVPLFMKRLMTSFGAIPTRPARRSALQS